MKPRHRKFSLRNCTRFCAICLAGLFTSFWLGIAHADDELEVTMMMAGPDEPLTENMVQEIRLPETLINSGRNAGRPDMGASKNRREAARDMGERMSERAREVRGKPKGIERKHSPGGASEQVRPAPAPTEPVRGNPISKPLPERDR